jgi:hypothetical protein
MLNIFHAWKAPVVWKAPCEALMVRQNVVQLMKVPQTTEHYCSGLNLDCFQNPKNTMRDDSL